ncbi:MAG: ATP-dependent DNA helicase PcrA [Clostridiales bacterium]|nr:ATP-dependent DNA helicase PcrA [Clostridiales bacterium]
MYNINDLNDMQLQIAKDTEGAILVTAGAGSGKTRLLTHRICYLIDENFADPTEILAITFTNKATREMKERIQNMSTMAYGVWVSTFHAMCVKILRENIENLDGYTKYFTICDENDRKKIIKSVVKNLGVDKEGFAEKLSWHISQAKNEGLSIIEYCKLISYDTDLELIQKGFSEYEEELRRCNSLDFDDLLYKTLVLFEEFSDVLQKYQKKFKYILVDEFQDTNVVQYKLVKLLSQYYGNIFVVGDEDQCIYTWRGANIDNIRNFLKEYNNAKIYKLEQNYRSTKAIISKANMLIKNNVSRIDKTLYTNNEDGDAVVYSQSNDEIEEAEYIARSINRLYMNGVPLNSIGVLMRISALSRLIEEKLLNYNLPFVVSGIYKFFDRLEIKNMLAYLRVLTNPKDDISLLRIINYPKRSIGQASIDKLAECAKVNNKSILEIVLDYNNYDLPTSLKAKISGFSEVMRQLTSSLETDSMSSLIKSIISKCEIMEQYATNSDEDVDRKANIEQLVQSMIMYEKNNPTASLTDYLESVTLENNIEESDGNGDNISVSTVHASKGLEFDYVYIIGAEEGCFPLSRALDDAAQLEEERRLMYVAITRAKKNLVITRAKSRFLYGNRSYTTESRFLKEMKLAAPTVNTNRQYYSENNYSYHNSYSNSYSNTYGTNYNKPSFASTSTKSSLDTSMNFISIKANKLKEQNKFSEYKINSMVSHPKFGTGRIVGLENVEGSIYASCQFDKIGVKKLSLDFAPLTLIK